MDTNLIWRVKTSFLEYLARTGGEATISGGALWCDDTFAFPIDELGEESANSTIRFRGQVRFVGHSGALDVTISDPRITITDRDAALNVLGGTPPDGGLRRLDLAHLDLTSDAECGVRLECAAELTLAGALLLGGVYSEGDPLDPLSLVVPCR